MMNPNENENDFHIELYLDTRHWFIHDEFGHIFSAGEAELLVNAGVVKKTNAAMQRLIEEDYSMETVKAEYVHAERRYG